MWRLSNVGYMLICRLRSSHARRTSRRGQFSLRGRSKVWDYSWSDFLPWVRTHTRNPPARPLAPTQWSSVSAAALDLEPRNSDFFVGAQSRAPSREDNLLKSFSKIKRLQERRRSRSAPSAGILNDGCRFWGASS